MGEAMVARHPHCTRCRELADLLPAGEAEELEQWAAAVATEDSAEATLHRATTMLTTRFGARRASILAPFGHGALRVIASSDAAMAGDLLIAQDRYPELAYVLRSQQPLWIADTTTSDLLAPVRHLLPAADIRSMIAVFLRLSGTGAVLRVISASRAFSEADLAALEFAAHLLEHEGNLPPPASDPTPWADLLLRLADVVFEVAGDGRILHVRGPVLERFGVPAEAVVGTSFEDHLVPEQVELARRRLLVLLEGGIPEGEPVFDLRLAGGARRAARAWGARVPGAAPRLRLALRLLGPGETEPAQSEIFRLAPVPLLVADEGGRVADANQALADLAGVPVAELLNRPLDSILDEHVLETVLRAGGRRIPVAVHRSLVGTVENVRSLVALTDLSPLLMAREQAAVMRSSMETRLAELDLLQLRLGELDTVKAHFLSTSAHELKTPLTVIQTYLETFLSDLAEGLDPEQLEFLKVIHDSVLRLRHLVVSLIDLAALESGRIHLAIARVEPGTLARQVATEMATLATRAEVELRSTVPAELAAMRADPDRVVQVLTNLVDNSLKYTPAGGTVTVAGREEGDSVVLEVRDTGIGIPEEHLTSIFDEFSTVPRSPDETRPGTGLGLSICRRLVRAMGGRIAAASPPGEGAVISMWLPRWPEDEESTSA